MPEIISYSTAGFYFVYLWFRVFYSLSTIESCCLVSAVIVTRVHQRANPRCSSFECLVVCPLNNFWALAKKSQPVSCTIKGRPVQIQFVESQQKSLSSWECGVCNSWRTWGRTIAKPSNYRWLPWTKTVTTGASQRYNFTEVQRKHGPSYIATPNFQARIVVQHTGQTHNGESLPQTEYKRYSCSTERSSQHKSGSWQSSPSSNNVVAQSTQHHYRWTEGG